MKEDLINQYQELQLNYVLFEKYIKNIVENLLLEEGIKYQNLTGRVKNLKSLKGKLERTSTSNMEKLDGNIKNMYDLCGLRIVLYDNEQLRRIIDLIENKFKVINFKNKSFNYNSNNITIEIESGVFKNYRCEIQLVTVMTHNLIEIGHDIFYKDINKLKEKDKKEYEDLENEYEKCLEEVYRLETRIDTLKKRKNNILENYKLLKEIISDNYINTIENNISTSVFYNVCNDIMAVAPYLSRNIERAKDFFDKKIILNLTKNLLKIEKNDYIFSDEFVFNDFLKVLTTYYNIWIEDSNEILDILIKYLEYKKNDLMRKNFFDAIKSIVNADLKNEKWNMIFKIKEWILRGTEYSEYRIKMINLIINNNFEYIEEVNSRTITINRKKLIYNEKGIELIKELFAYACKIFLKNQNKSIYEELIAITYKFDFLANEILEFFYNNFDNIHDIYRYDLIRKIYYSFKDITLDSRYYKKIKSDKFYDVWKYLCYDYFDEEVERGNKREIEKRAKRKIDSYIKNINKISQGEIIRIVKNYNKMIKENIHVIFSLKKAMFLIGKKYHKITQIYKNNKNEYLYLGIKSRKEKVIEIEDRYDIKVLKALQDIYVGKVFENYIRSKERNVDKDIIICTIISSKLYIKKKYVNVLFKIINYYNKNELPLLYNYFYLSHEFIDSINNKQSCMILKNYYFCLLNEKSIIELDINLLNLFEKYPKECRDFLDMIVKDQKTRKLEYRNMYIYEAKNYKEERKNNLLLIVDWLKKYNYYDIYKILDGIIRIEDAEIIDDLCTILDKTDDEECLKAVSKLLINLELGIDIWKVVRAILLKASDTEIIGNLSIAMREIGVVSSLYQAHKVRKEQIDKIKNEEKNKKCKDFLKKLSRDINATMEYEELNEKRMQYEMQIKDEKYDKQSNNEKEG